ELGPVELGRRGEPGALRGEPVKRGLLVGVLAVAESLDERALEREARGETARGGAGALGAPAARAGLAEIGGDRGVVLRGPPERLEGQAVARLPRQGAVMGRELRQDRLVLPGIGEDDDAVVVLGGGAD